MPFRSPAYFKFVEHNALMVEIEEIGWDLAIHFGSIEEEVKMVRERAGFVDYSFQNETAVVGKGAFDFLQKVLVNDLRKIRPGKAIYSSMLDEHGSLIDDATVFWLEEDYFLYNGGALKAPVNEWLHKQAAGFDVKLVHTGLCLLSVQGPKSGDILKPHVDIDDLGYYEVKQTTVRGMPVIAGRLGYSGELGYELLFIPEFMSNMWDFLMEIGRDHDMGPYGIGATDVLSIEKGLLHPLDYYPGASPLELGLGWTVGFDKGDFFGKEALLKKKEKGLDTRLIAFEVLDAGFEAAHLDHVFKGDRKVGEVTHCAPGLSVGKALLGRAWVSIDTALEGEELQVEHEGRKGRVRATLKRDWYDPSNKRRS